MNIRTVLTTIAILLTNTLFAQYKISGKIVDKTDNTFPLPGVSVFLEHANDSTNKTGTVTDTGGYFIFNNLTPGRYLLRSMYVGFTAYQKTVNITNANAELGTIEMAPASTTLQNVIITAEQIKARQKGDTSEFNANAYKTNPDANTEDLVTKMPGVTNEDGKLKVGGEDVKQVLVDGKPFFGDDPATAVKNLPAEVVDKIQVFDKLSDQAQFTGFDDGQSQKTINIITRAGKSNGQFGKVYAGFGTDNRYIAGGNVNFFKDKRRISLIAMSNNINQQNFNTEDLLGVVGNSGGQNHGGFRRGSGGYRGGGGRSGGYQGGGSRGGGGGSDVSNFLVGPQGGIATTNAIGLNYSDNWGKKVKVSGSYFFNATDNTNVTTLTRQYFTAADSNLVYNENSNSNAKNQNHRLNLRLEYTIDSANSIIETPKLSVQHNNTSTTLSGTNILPGDVPVSHIENNNSANNTGYTFGNNFLFRHKFAKRGRTASFNLNTQINNRSGDGKIYSLNQFIGSDTTILDQQNTLSSNGHTISPNISYTEPIGKQGQLMANYSPSFTKNRSDKETYELNPATKQYTDFDSLYSNKFDNTYTTHSGGLSYRYNDKKYSIMAGANAQYAMLEGEQTFPHSFSVSKNFFSVLPQAMFNYRYTTTKNLRIMYRTNTDAPTISQLQDVVDITNPLLLKTGNPDLKQDYQHTFIIRYGGTNTKTGRSLFAFAYANFMQNYIGNQTFIPLNDTIFSDGVIIKRGSQLTRPVNLDGYFNGRTFITYGFPVRSIKSNLNLNGGLSYNSSPALINNTKNISNNFGINGGLTLGSNISENVDFTLSYTGNYSVVKNSLQTTSNNTYYTHTASFKFNWIFLKGFVFNTNITDLLYTGLSQSYNQNYFLWNASFGYKFLKNRALEVKLSMYDILNQNRSVNRTVTDTYIEDSNTEVLKQYLMLNLTYTLRNFKALSGQ
jgi:hypothetical protein